MLSPYDQDLKPGDKLTFTAEMEQQLDELGEEHHLEHGDELVVVAVDGKRSRSVCISAVNDSTWRAWVYLVAAEHAQEVWLEAQGIMPPRKPISYWIEEFNKLPPNERAQAWENHRQQLQDELLLAHMRHNPKNKLN